MSSPFRSMPAIQRGERVTYNQLQREATPDTDRAIMLYRVPHQAEQSAKRLTGQLGYNDDDGVLPVKRPLAAAHAHYSHDVARIQPSTGIEPKALAAIARQMTTSAEAAAG